MPNVYLTNAQPLTAAAQADLYTTNLRNWPDGILGRAVITPFAKYNWIASNNGKIGLTVGSLMQLLSPGPPNIPTPTSIPIQGLPMDPHPPDGTKPDIFPYAAGGPVIGASAQPGAILPPGAVRTPFLLQVVHAELWPNKTPSMPYGDNHKFLGHLGMARSLDYGNSWTWLGVILEPSIRITDPNRGGSTEIGGGPIVFAGNNIYCYYLETAYVNGVKQFFPSVASAPISDVFNQAAAGTVSTRWRKWQGYGKGFVGLNRGGDYGVALPGLPHSANFIFDWFDVAYLTDKRLYLMVFAQFRLKPDPNDPTQNVQDTNELFAATSSDGLTWQVSAGTEVNPLPITNLRMFEYYPSLVFPFGNDRTGDSGNIHLYYVISPYALGDTAHGGWLNANVFHRRVTVI